MASAPPLRAWVGIAAATLLCGGCTVVIQPAWHKPVIDPNLALTPPPVLGAGGAPLKGPPPPPGTPPGPIGYPPAAGGEQVSFLMQRIANSEDDRKALAARLQQLEGQLREKDQVNVQASYEVQESTRQMRRTREELTQWKQEMDDLRGKLRTMERENRVTMETILNTLQQYVDKDGRTPR